MILYRPPTGKRWHAQNWAGRIACTRVFFDGTDGCETWDTAQHDGDVPPAEELCRRCQAMRYLPRTRKTKEPLR